MNNKLDNAHSCFELYTIVVYWVTVVIWLVYFLLQNGFMDYLINFMNNTVSFPHHYFDFFANYNPIAFPHSFFTPFSKIDYS
jgi:hypothetical protein